MDDDAAPWVPELTDGVVFLNGHRPGDEDAHLAGEDADTAWWFGWWPDISTEDSVREALLHWRQQWRDRGSTRTFAVRRLDTGQLAGGCQLRLRDDGVGLVSYWTSAQHRGRGYASRALGLLCQYARDSLG